MPIFAAIASAAEALANPKPPPEVDAPTPAPLPPLAVPIYDAVLDVVRAHAPRVLHLDVIDLRSRDICSPTGVWLERSSESMAFDRFRHRVSGTLSRMAKTGVVVRCGKAKYRAYARDAAQPSASMSLNDAVLRVLRDAAPVPLSSASIASRVLAHYPRTPDMLDVQPGAGRSRHEHSVQGALSHLKARGKVEHAFGMYSLAATASADDDAEQAEPPAKPARLSLSDAVRRVLADAAPKSMGSADIANAVLAHYPRTPDMLEKQKGQTGTRHEQSVGGLLWRMERKGEIVRVAPGEYAALGAGEQTEDAPQPSAEADRKPPTLRDAIDAILRAHAPFPQPLTLDEIEERARAIAPPTAAQEGNYASGGSRYRTQVSAALTALGKSGDAVRAGHALWRAANDSDRIRAELEDALSTLDLAIEAAQTVRDELAVLLVGEGEQSEAA